MADKPSGAPESLLPGVWITGRTLLVVEGQDEKQMFLASKPKACLRVGEAACAGYWPFEDSAFDQIRALVERLVAVADA